MGQVGICEHRQIRARRRQLHLWPQMYWKLIVLIVNSLVEEQNAEVTSRFSLKCIKPSLQLELHSFFAEMSKKRQRYAVVNLENNFSISAKVYRRLL
jgi:hypothetical protein